MATKKPVAEKANTKTTRRVLPKVFEVKTETNDGSIGQVRMIRAKSIQAARTAAVGKISVTLATPESLMAAGKAGVDIENA